MNRRLLFPEIFPIRRSSKFGPVPLGSQRGNLLGPAVACVCAALLLAAASAFRSSPPRPSPSIQAAAKAP